MVVVPPRALLGGTDSQETVSVMCQLPLLLFTLVEVLHGCVWEVWYWIGGNVCGDFVMLQC